MTPDNSSDMANPIDEILGVGDGSVLDLPAAVDPSVYETLVGDQHAPHSQTRFVETDLRCCKKHFLSDPSPIIGNACQWLPNSLTDSLTAV